MNAEMKAKWLEALRSGKFSQAQGILKVNPLNGEPGYCCLGVLCEISGYGTWKDDNDYSSPLTPEEQAQCEKMGDYATTDEASGELSSVLLHRFGMTHGQQSELIDLNDAQGANFATIADYIEANL